jgi:biotin/methionine sulfoxide reductase
MSTSKQTYTSAHWGSYRVNRVGKDGEKLELISLDSDNEPMPFAKSMAEAVSSETRILKPAIREGYLRHGPSADAPRGDEPFVEVSWDIALDLAAVALKQVYENCGAEAVFGGSYGWASAGRFHHALSQVHRFLNCLGGYTASVNTYSHAAAEVLLPHVIGEEDDIIYNGSTWPTIIANTQLMVCFGGLPVNPSQINPGGVSKHSVRSWLHRCNDSGIRRIDIAPIRTADAEDLEAEWHPIRPNTDTAIMMGLAKALIDNGSHDLEFLDRYTVGFEVFEDYLYGKQDGIEKSPEWASKISGLSADRIRQLAVDIANNRTLLTATWSLQRADHGEQPFWMLITLAAMIGQIGLPGGGFSFGLTSMNGIANPVNRRRFASLPRGNNPVKEKIPVARITDLLLSPGASVDYNGEQLRYPDIQLVYWAGGNPFHHHQDLAKLNRAWRKPETIICNELSWNALARRCDIVFPAAGPLERNDIMATKSDSRIIAMQKACAPPGEARTDYEIFSQLASRLGVEEIFTEGRDENDWLRWLYERSTETLECAGVKLPGFDEFWEEGLVTHGSEEFERVLLDRFRSDPERYNLPTPSGLIEIFSEKIASFGYEDCPGHPVWLEPREWLGAENATGSSLHLISDQPKTRLHSQLDDVGCSKASKVNSREPARLNPKDAGERGIQEGDTMRIFNQRGSVLASAVISSDICRGVVHLSTGAWFDPVKSTDSDDITCVHGNPNVLTGDFGTSRLSQGPSPLSTLVEVELYEGALRECEIHSQPEFVHAPR